MAWPGVLTAMKQSNYRMRAIPSLPSIAGEVMLHVKAAQSGICAESMRRRCTGVVAGLRLMG